MSPGGKTPFPERTDDTFCNLAYRGYDFCRGTIWISFYRRRRNIREDKIVIIKNNKLA
jgi:hypothetical protein